jgi:hypothetical protein
MRAGLLGSRAASSAWGTWSSPTVRPSMGVTSSAPVHTAWIGADNVAPRLSEFMIKDVDAVRAIAERAQVDLGLLGDVLDSAAIRDGVLNGGVAADRDLGTGSRAEPGAIKS